MADSRAEIGKIKYEPGGSCNAKSKEVLKTHTWRHTLTMMGACQNNTGDNLKEFPMAKARITGETK